MLDEHGARRAVMGAYGHLLEAERQQPMVVTIPSSRPVLVSRMSALSSLTAVLSLTLLVYILYGSDTSCLTIESISTPI